MRKELHPISSLIIKHLEGVASDQEKRALDVWINEHPDNKALFEELSDEYRMSRDLATHSEDKKATWDKILTLAPELAGTPVKHFSWLRYTGVAGILLVIGLGLWYFTTTSKTSEPLVQAGKERYKNDVEAQLATMLYWSWPMVIRSTWTL
ncbi:hypothetical protein [Paraflavitalea speifideaquila]|uniref:hypothetical protein n=1 Tax=Paraflavitalea speifideaquila TaxID=3076558 RepID=UPI0028EA74C2|nr:hypothetical protein [Paraflavitalea speifideiaquila]